MDGSLDFNFPQQQGGMAAEAESEFATPAPPAPAAPPLYSEASSDLKSYTIRSTELKSYTIRYRIWLQNNLIRTQNNYFS